MPKHPRRYLQTGTSLKPLSRREARALLEAALQAADPARAVREARLGSTAKVLAGRVRVIAVGKAAPAMLRGLRQRVSKAGGRILDAWVVSPGASSSSPRVRSFRSTHPLPSLASVRAARKLEAVLRASRSGDRWVILLSGGASSLLGAPRPGLSLSDLGRASRILLKAGAPIEEINAIRKHLSRLGGGGMLSCLEDPARKGPPVEVLTLALSDVPSNRLDTIGSGPSVPDRTTFKQCLAIARRYRLSLPRSVLSFLKEGARGRRPETLKKVPRSVRARAFVVASADQSLRAASMFAKANGHPGRSLGILDGDTRREARKQALQSRGKLLLSGGELTVQVRGRGKGGRNQEFVLAGLLECSRVLPEGSRFRVFAAGTDGRDGNTPAAGAWADERTLAAAKKLGLDPATFLAANDSHTFFKRVGGLITTGPTGTNVMDFRLMLVLR